MEELKIGDWVDIFRKTTLYDEDKKDTYITDDDLPAERGEIVKIKTHNGKKIVKLHTVIHDFSMLMSCKDEPPKRVLPEHDFLIGYHPTDNCKIVEDYENKTIEELSKEYHKMFDDWQEKYIIGPRRKEHEKWKKEKREREKYKEEYKNEIDFINLYLNTSTEEHDKIDKIQMYKLLREYRR